MQLFEMRSSKMLLSGNETWGWQSPTGAIAFEISGNPPVSTGYTCNGSEFSEAPGL